MNGWELGFTSVARLCFMAISRFPSLCREKDNLRRPKGENWFVSVADWTENLRTLTCCREEGRENIATNWLYTVLAAHSPLSVSKDVSILHNSGEDTPNDIQDISTPLYSSYCAHEHCL